MHCRVESKDIEEIGSTDTVQQTSFWARVKYDQGFEPYAFGLTASKDLVAPEENPHESVEDDLLILIRHINSNYCFAYVPYGPEIEPEYEHYGLFLEELSEVIKPQLPANCILIRYDLPWENQWAGEQDAYDEQGNWTGPPSVNAQEMRLNINTRNWNLLKSPGDILPTNTFLVNLEQKEEKLLLQMKPKTRYNIRLSFRKGVSVNEYGMDKVDEWYRIYEETARRNNLTLHDREYFTSMLELREKSGDDVDISLLMADHEGAFLAAMFLILSKERGTYLYGASSSRNRNLMASYAIQWEAMKIARQSGCREYDMFGAAPNPSRSHPLYGLYRFKSGFGGSLFHRMGCWDYPLIRDEYLAFRAQETQNQKYHTN